MTYAESVYRLVKANPEKGVSWYKDKLTLSDDEFDAALTELMAKELVVGKGAVEMGDGEMERVLMANPPPAAADPKAFPDIRLPDPGAFPDLPLTLRLTGPQVLALERANSRLERMMAAVAILEAQMETAQVRVAIAKNEYDAVCGMLGIDPARDFSLRDDGEVVYANEADKKTGPGRS